ncbi:hypothetical protein [Martelella radicis]|uniref:Uncharacterized protein n=1 Tax=Martelella radicis TaxID=1397476 RepID=A0A7W6KMG6_9HYPH|nr:hypothetical protein [Martelella radicis]MBB4123961.1 hypothetical protein [Martelella radicis]
MTEDNTRKPVRTLRDGQVKAAIWENDGEKGSFDSVTFARSYRDQDGNYADTNRFSGTDLLKLSRLAEQSYDAVQERQNERNRQNYAERQRQDADRSKRRPDREYDR